MFIIILKMKMVLFIGIALVLSFQNYVFGSVENLTRQQIIEAYLRVSLDDGIDSTDRGVFQGTGNQDKVDLTKPFSMPKSFSINAGENETDVAFNQWKEQYGHKYKNSEHENKAKATFSKKHKQVMDHNKKFESGEETFWQTLDGYSALEYNDLVILRTGLLSSSKIVSTNPKLSAGGRTTVKKSSTTTQATTLPCYDHTISTYYPPVRDQGMCGSCWAFAALTPIEFQLNKQIAGQNFNLAEQQLVSCDGTNYGCGGGLPDMFYSSMISSGNGVTYESIYPYTSYSTGATGSCSLTFQNEMFKVISQVENTAGARDGWGTGTEADIQKLLPNGPVVVAMYAPSSLFSYSGGIFNGCTSGNTPNHAVVVVGCGVENGVNYWLIRNSWGANWGLGGHFKMVRGVNMCSITKYYTQPTIQTV